VFKYARVYRFRQWLLALDPGGDTQVPIRIWDNIDARAVFLQAPGITDHSS
jgi:hypothetical protein